MMTAEEITKLWNAMTLAQAKITDLEAEIIRIKDELNEVKADARAVRYPRAS